MKNLYPGCDCVNVEFQSYGAAVQVDIPPHMQAYRENREAAGLSGQIAIDKCALPEIKDLWEKGIRTYGSCCGHNKGASMVNVHLDDDEKMLEMGYERWPVLMDPQWKATFYLKTVGFQSASESPAQ